MGVVAFAILLCTLAWTNAQYSSYPMWGMGNSMWNGGMRYPGQMYGGMMGPGMWRPMPMPMMRASGGASMSGMSGSVSGERSPAQALTQGILNVPKVPGSEEVLSHMALASQNVKPYTDTISDFLYGQDQLKSRQAVMIPAYLQAMNQMRANAYNQMEDCGPQEMARWNREISEWTF